MVDVLIIEIETDRLVARHSVQAQGWQQQDYFDCAWDCAVDDGDVAHEAREQYRFELASAAKSR